VDEKRVELTSPLRYAGQSQLLLPGTSLSISYDDGRTDRLHCIPI